MWWRLILSVFGLFLVTAVLGANSRASTTTFQDCILYVSCLVGFVLLYGLGHCLDEQEV